MTDSRTASVLAAADELHRLDEAVAAEIAQLDELAAAAAALRARAGEVRGALLAIPSESAAVERSVEEARAREGQAHDELSQAEQRLAGLESSRRRRDDELAQARQAVTTARESLLDARHRVERLLGRRLELRDQEQTLRGEAALLVDRARDVANRIRDVPRVMEAGKGEPGDSLEALDAWGGAARAALFVARGTVENERERIVLEASSLAASVLGEAPAGASVALVRRRLAESLAESLAD